MPAYPGCPGKEAIKRVSVRPSDITFEQWASKPYATVRGMADGVTSHDDKSADVLPVKYAVLYSPSQRILAHLIQLYVLYSLQQWFQP